MPCYKENENNRFLLLFSCPGKKEEDKGSPCAGVTGNNLTYLLARLHELNPDEFPKERDQYYINNAWPGVKFINKTNSTEANKNELLEPENLKRLITEISHVEKIICFGENAKLVVKHLEKSFITKNIPVYSSHHLSPRCINCSIKEDIRGNPLIKGQTGNTHKRIDVIANQLLASLKIINND